MTAPPQVFGLPGGEPILRYGANKGLQLLVLQPLFEEMNRCRATVTTLCRYLAARGYGCWLLDLPGCGESLSALDTIRWQDWDMAVRDALACIQRESGEAAIGTVSIRGGALLDGAASRRWRLSPVSGASLLTDLRRSGLLASGAYHLSDDLMAALSTAEPDGPARVVRLDGDDRSSDVRIEGPTLWRRPEPLAATDLAARLADDIDDWASQ